MLRLWCHFKDIEVYVDGYFSLLYSAYTLHTSFLFLQVAEMLIGGGADVNAADDYGYTPLHIASKHGHVEAVQCLLNHGAAVNHGFDDDCVSARYHASMY